MTQEQLAYIVDRSPRTIMYNENDGQHPSLNTFYQMVTMFDISVDQYFYPSKNGGSECRKRIDAMLGSLDNFFDFFDCSNLFQKVKSIKFGIIF